MTAFVCPSTTGPGDCQNHEEHVAPRGCVHFGTWAPDRKEREVDDE